MLAAAAAAGTLSACSSPDATVTPDTAVTGAQTSTPSITDAATPDTTPATMPATSVPAPTSTLDVSANGSASRAADPIAYDLATALLTSDEMAEILQAWPVFSWDPPYVARVVPVSTAVPIPFNSTELAFAPLTQGGVESTFKADTITTTGTPTTADFSIRAFLAATPADAKAFIRAFDDRPELEITSHRLVIGADRSVAAIYQKTSRVGPSVSHAAASIGRLVVWVVVGQGEPIASEDIAAVVAEHLHAKIIDAYPVLKA